MPDADGNLTDADYDAFVAASDKDTLWWALYRLSNALHAARYDDPACKGSKDGRGGPYSIVHMTADHWLPQIPGMPTLEAVAAECRADEAYHETTYRAERMGIRITGDEFI